MKKKKEQAYHLAEAPDRLAQKFGPNATCLKVKSKDDGTWQKVSWGCAAEYVRRTAQAIVEFGIREQECIGVFSENMDKFIYTDLAAFRARAISVPIYATSSPQQVKEIMTDAEVRLLFVGAQQQYNNAYKVLRECPSIKQLIVFSPEVKLHTEDTTTLFFEDFLKLGDTAPAEAETKMRSGNATLSDIAVIIYTSGTNGKSKGVELTHKNISTAINAHLNIPQLHPRYTTMNFLPLTHVFEKMWVFLCLQKGIYIAVGENPKEILQNLSEVHPHYMCNVPRFWEKVYLGVQEKIKNFPPLLRRITQRAIETGHTYHFDYIDKQITPPIGLRIKYFLFKQTLFDLVKRKIGLQNGLFFPTAGAALADPINMFLRSIGIPIVLGYGLTETSATLTYCRVNDFKFGSVGRALEGVSIKIDPANSEILVKGDTVTKGYHNMPEANAEAFTEDGWFRTGDIGWLDQQGNLYFKERLKDLYKTTNGKYISPQLIEGLLTANRYIEQAMIVAEGHSYVSALIYPDWSTVIEEMKQHEVYLTELKELAQDPTVYTFIEGHLALAQQTLASYEKVKRFILLTEPFSIENGMLTNSLKIKRSVVLEHYKERIGSLYDTPYTESLKETEKAE